MMPLRAYVGSRTTRERQARGEGITVWEVDATGELSRQQVLGDLVNPSYLTLNRRGDRLYTVHGDGEAVSVLAVDPIDGSLQLMQTLGCGGRNPVHLALEPQERFLIVSNHLSGNVAVLPLEAGGRLGPVSSLTHLPGTPGPHRSEQPFSKPHFNPFDPSGQWVLVPDKGLDRIFSFRFAEGHLTPADMPHAQLREGAGPRHLAFHPAGRWAYVVNELDSTVTACAFDPGSGALSPFQRLSSVPDDHTGDNRAAGIVVDGPGRAVYASNRGHDSIAAFAIDPACGRLRPLGCAASGGRTPRFFALDPSGQRMYVLNEDSDSITMLAVDAATGALRATGRTVACGSPVCMVFSRPG